MMRVSLATAALVGVRPALVRAAARFASMPMTSLAEAPSSICVPTATGLNSIGAGLSGYRLCFSFSASSTPCNGWDIARARRRYVSVAPYARPINKQAVCPL